MYAANLLVQEHAFCVEIVIVLRFAWGPKREMNKPIMFLEIIFGEKLGNLLGKMCDDPTILGDCVL